MHTGTPRQWAATAGVTLVAVVAIGVPTGVVPTPFYTRMTPAQPQASRTSGPRGRRAVFAGVLTAFAVGCPICNKLVVLAIGVSGALSYWAPAQPFMAFASPALLSHGLVRRLCAAAPCPVMGAEALCGPRERHRSTACDERPLVPQVPSSAGEGSGRASAG